jgi:hypothetical protein
MSPGLAGRAFTLLLVAGIGGLPIIPAMGGCLLSAEAQEAGEPATPLPATAGNPPGGAFFIDLREGFHPKTQYISNFDIDNEHLLDALTKRASHTRWANLCSAASTVMVGTKR